jgi:phage baseplate assembly protein gpV
MNQAIEAGLTIKEKANILIELKVGASKITITPVSITLDAPMITINGLAMTTIKGGVVLIN